MILSSILTQNFRNLEARPHQFHPTVNLLVGRNGQGKTNLLEAIYFLATSKSFRTTRSASLLEFGSSTLFVSGEVERNSLTKKLSIGLEQGDARRRVVQVNEEKVTLPKYIAELTVLAYSASRLEIVRGVPEERRRFLDRGIAANHASYLEDLTAFGRALKQRNALLQAVGAGHSPQSLLDPWDEELARRGAAVQRARLAYVEELSAGFRAIVERHAYHVRDVEFLYKPSGHGPDELLNVIRRHRRDEVRARMTLYGPQRDTLDFMVEGRPAAEVLSGGEQKMIVLFLKFAKLELFRARFDEAPVFVLDDIDAELDLQILENLLSRLPVATQVFATSAKEEFLAALEAGPHRRLTLENGRVTTVRDFS
jgi:DNA replication and repair protein RecF